MLQQILSSLDGLTDLEQKEVLRVLMSKDGRLEKVKALLGITGTDQDEVLLFVIQTVEDLVLAYINQDTLPAPLENALIVMCVSYYKAAGLGTTQAAVGPVASVKRGDVTTSFANASRRFRIGVDLQPGRRRRRLLRLANGPERVPAVKVVIVCSEIPPQSARRSK